MNSNGITIKTKEEIRTLREAGKILSGIVNELKCSLKSGMTTKDVDDIAERLMKERKVIPAFKGYRGFPACVCLSINEEVVHGIPSRNRIIQDGDIVSLDVGLIYNDYYSDMAVSAGVGRMSDECTRLLDVTYQALLHGIKEAKPNNHLSDISHSIQQYAESHHFSVVREFVGHGIGKKLHEDPEIPNFGPPNQGPVLKEGMVFAIEPMVNMGDWRTKILGDKWTVVTQDSQPSAHFEHSIAITGQGPVILTQEKN
jgi:methionyl aminopeptidase